MPGLSDLPLQARAIWARMMSHLKKNWTLGDYPVVFRFHPTSGSPRSASVKPQPWSASIVNWPAMMAFGGSRLDALNALEKSFDAFKLKEPLPRPGSKVPMRFASTSRVGLHADLAKSFAKKILEIDWASISDESTLWDFHSSQSHSAVFEKIRSVYGVDVSDISSGNLADIFDRIASDSRPTS